MNPVDQLRSSPQTSGYTTSVISSNKVIRNTYLLLSLTLLFSAITAGASIAVASGFIGVLGLVGAGILWRYVPRYSVKH